MAHSDKVRNRQDDDLDASLIQMYESGECSVGDLARNIGAPAWAVYDRMRRLELPLLGQPGCKLRNYKSYGPRYNQVIFSKEQVALLVSCNAEGWSDSRIARKLTISANSVRRLRRKLLLPAHIRKDIPIGTRYGNLTVVSALSPKNKKRGDASTILSSRSLCRCECGEQRVAFNEDLRAGNTTTCGCRINLRNVDSGWIRIFHQYIGGANSRNVKFALSVEQVKYICSLPCYYCGASQSNVALPPKRCHRSRLPLMYNGIDQVVPCGGYHPGNVLPCCCFCNRAKSNLPLEVFVPWINRVFGQQSKTKLIKRAALAFGEEVNRRL